ncbi:MAG: deoxyguanosinetriphosphate triphosphohydrolase [Candidatus Nanopelagicales bacterium]
MPEYRPEPPDDRLSPGYDPADERRYVEEPPKRSGRTAFARDRARVLHSAALRRLAAKTQVLVAGQEDFPRTRLTHTLEVAQVGRELGASFGCDPDLVEVACLAHDLGHPPYGHNGEDALDAVCAGIGGFEGNAQSLRVLTRLEAKTFDPATGRSVGLNLTRAALDAATKYPWPRREGTRKFGVYADDVEVFDWVRAPAPEDRRCFEAQVMDWADDVAYSVHDVEDAVHGGHLDLRALASGAERARVVQLCGSWYVRGADPAALEAALDRLLALPYWPGSYDGSQRGLAALKNLTSQLIGRFCSAAETATRSRSGGGRLTRYAADLVVPEPTRHEVAVMKAVAAVYVMQREGAEAVYEAQRATLTELVSALVLDGGRSLDPWLRPAYAAAPDDAARLRVVVDQVASLTDVSVVDWHHRLCR